MNRTIVVNGIEPAPLSLRWPLGVNLDLNVRMLAQNGTPVDPTHSQFVLLPRSRGGVIPFDMQASDPANGIARVEVSGSQLTDVSGYNIELYSRRANAVPSDPPIPTGLAAKGVLVTEGSGYRSDGPMYLINVPTIVGPPGPMGATGPVGATGSTGQRGSIWTTGPSVPTATDALPGDMYLDESNGDVYRFDGAVWVRGTF